MLRYIVKYYIMLHFRCIVVLYTCHSDHISSQTLKTRVPESPHDQGVRRAITTTNVNLGRCFSTQGLGFRFGVQTPGKIQRLALLRGLAVGV